jgi:hypothetical protein
MLGTLSEETKALLDQQHRRSRLAKMWNDIAAGWENAAAAGQKMIKSIPSGAANDNGPRPIVPAKDTTDSKDALDRSIESLKRHTEVTLADADAQGSGAQALQEYRAIAELVAAAERAGIDVTGKLGEKFADLATKAGEAARALAQAKVDSNRFRVQDAPSLSNDDCDRDAASRHLWQRCSSRDGIDRGVADATSTARSAKGATTRKFCRDAGQGAVRRQGGFRLGLEGPRGSVKISRQHGDQAASLRRLREGGGLGDLGGRHLGDLAGQSRQ